MRRRERCSDKQILHIAKEYVATVLTIRELSEKYNIARSTLHRCLKYILPTLNVPLAKQVEEVAKRKKYEGECKGGRNHTKKKE